MKSNITKKTQENDYSIHYSGTPIPGGGGGVNLPTPSNFRYVNAYVIKLSMQVPLDKNF